MVERLFCKQRVVGSNPSRSTASPRGSTAPTRVDLRNGTRLECLGEARRGKLGRTYPRGMLALNPARATRLRPGNGVMTERLGRGLQSSAAGFDSRSRFHDLRRKDESWHWHGN